jgi:small conductance mechanosensitive channel
MPSSIDKHTGSQMTRDWNFIAGVPWATLLAAGLRIVLIILLALVLASALSRLIRLFRVRVTRHWTDPDSIKRATTLGRAFRYLSAVVVALIAGMLILSELGVSIAPILGAAGVVGVAIGFGAQSLVKDYFTGLFILLEDQIRQGDVVRVAGIGGLVEEVTLRYVRLRDYDGVVHFVPNSLISTVSNMGRGFSKSVIDVGVAYREDIDEAFGIMRRVASEMRKDSVFGPKITEDLEIAGVEQWADSAVTLRCRFTVLPLEQWNVRREYLRRLKKAFDEAGIEIPYPHLTLYAGQGKDGSSPAFRTLADAKPAKSNAS